MSGYYTKSGRRTRGIKRDASQMFKDGLNWDKYLQLCNLPAAPDRFFTQVQDVILTNKFAVNQKLEAQDPRNPTSICLATVIMLQGPRILLRLDGSDKCNDFWRLVNSGDIYPLGTHESKGILLQPPLGYTKNVSTWASFLAKNRIKADRAPEDCFVTEPEPVDRNLFEIGMKLEAVDKKNPDLICPATIGDVKADQIFISFDGWRGAIDYWCHYTSRDIFPVGWCESNEHPLSSPGTKGDNPAVVERLKIIAEESKRQTRSGSSNQSESEKSVLNKAKTNEYSATVTSGILRCRAKARSSRSLTPVPKKLNLVEKANEEPTDQSISPKRTKAPSPTPTESSVDEDTCDSSPSSSQQSSDSYSSEDNEKDEAGDLRHADIYNKQINGESVKKKNDDKSILETGKNMTADAEDLQDVVKCDYEKRRKSDKKSRKRKKKERKKLKKFSKYGNVVSPSHSRRKRFASMGDEDRSLIKLKKRKKRKHKHSTSSLYDSPRKRMLGFGLPATTFTPSKTSLLSSSIKSPSFLDNAAPSSMFGLNRDDIVKKATEGWPSGFLVGGPGKVVTSDNKLARFGSVSATNTACQTLPENEIKIIKPQVENVVLGHVTTTTDIEENDEKNTCKDNESATIKDASSIAEDNPAEPETNKSNTDVIKTISSQTVSSTTNPAQSTPSLLEEVTRNVSKEKPASSKQMVDSQEPKVEKKRSRNPQRWSVRDVINYLSENEPALTQHVALFLFHEIDGQALLLLNSAIAVKYMNMKLGPALKLANLVDKLKQLVPPPRSSL